ncbi:MAG: Rne/Rng family ribonuclease, partial [Vampirovibrionia bacterium]
NLGADRMGFLHASDVPGKGELKNRLEPKQKLLVQIMKEPTGHKGPRVSTALSIPGRFVVLMPEEKGINVSRKILSPKERSRLKSIVSLIKPPGVGVIIRTEAENQSEDELKEDLEIVLEKWQNIVTTADTVTPPTLIHRDQDLLYRVIREACTEEVTEIHIDSPFGQHRVNQLIQTWNLGKDIKVNVHKGTESIIVAKGLDKDIKAALQSKVHLPSGGYLYVQTTEALTVIDVNSGRFTSSQTQGETIRLTNLEAIDEIARQLRLRNIGGMIIIDFIDMDNRVDQLAILEAFEMALQPDKAKPQVGQLSDLGLVELTRHRQGQSLSEIFTKKCPACNGTGNVIEDLTFATVTMEGDSHSRSRLNKVKQVPRPKAAINASKQAVASAKAELAQNKKIIKNKIMQSPQVQQKPEYQKPEYQKPQHQHHKHNHNHNHNQYNIDVKKDYSESEEVEIEETMARTTPALSQTPEVESSQSDSIYFKPDETEEIDNISLEKLRKTYIDKKYYPELSQIIRFSGVPLKYAKQHFGEDVNMVDVFTILDEMEAAFARAASTPPNVEIVPEQVVFEEKEPESNNYQAVQEEIIEDNNEKPEEENFNGSFKISTEGEDFEDLYESIDEDNSEESEDSEENDEDEENTDDDEASTNEATKDEASKKPVKRGRKPGRTTTARKRGRPKSK